MKGSNKKELTYICCRRVSIPTANINKFFYLLTNPFAINSFFLFVIDLICAIEPCKEKAIHLINE
jgi:hypothetical protein